MVGISLLVLTAVATLGQTRGQSFEVASIRPHLNGAGAPILKEPGITQIRVSGNRVELRAVTLRELVVGAYGIKDYQVSGGPGWATGIGNMFDVDAKAPGDATPGTDQVRWMLQELLTDRFHLKLRRESKLLQVYNLVIAKGGPKLKPVQADAPAVPETNRVSMEKITALWSLYVDRPVIDHTGLTGLFDFPLRLWTLDVNAADDADMAARALTALQDELGLRAEAARATIELLVIESAEKPSPD